METKRLNFIQLIIFVIVAVSAVSCLPTKIAPRARSMKPKVCNTEECKQSASTFLQNMDKSVDPCDNFYQFVCGNFTKNAVIPDNRPTVDLFFLTHNHVQEQLRTSLESEISNEDPYAFKLAKNYYKTCMNEDKIDKTSESEFLQILEELGGWPVLVGKSWDESTFNWTKMMYKAHNIGFSSSYFFRIEISPDLKNNSKYSLYVDQASLGASQEYLSKGLDHPVINAYLKYMVEYAVLFGANREQAMQELTESLNFEIELSRISLPAGERRNTTKLYNPMSVEQLNVNYPYIPWLEYFNKILSPYIKVESNDIVVVQAPDFFKNLTDLLNRTPKRAVANYAFWRIAHGSASFLSERVLKLQRNYTSFINGNKAKSPRWQICVASVNNNLQIAVGALYVRKYFSMETKTNALDMVNHIRDSFHNMLMEIDWMDEKTKSSALDKLAYIIPLVAFPDELLDDKKIDNYYKELTLNPDSFLKTILNFVKFSGAKELSKFYKPPVKAEWSGFYSAAAIVNAFYNPDENSIQLPAAILQGDFFKTENPKYINYGSIGQIIGHEMTHGFDDSGRLSDKNGNLIDWWQPETQEEYLKRAQCIIDQYSNYTVKEVDLNIIGENTQGENIADNGGIKEAYLAYENFEKENGPEPVLPGFESYTTKQMFWISNANMWCSRYRPEYLKNLILTDPHTPSEYRVIGTLSNMPQFARDFNCPLGSPMNPVKKCSVW